MTGTSKADLSDTPVVVVDLEVVRANISRLQEQLDGLGLANRPHIKTHKIIRLAKLQIEAGAIGIACQKIGEAEVMADGGIKDILIPYNIVGAPKLDRLASLAGRCRVSVSADSTVVAARLSDRFRNAANPLDVLVEADTGHGRCGVQSPEEAVDLARTIARLPGLEFGGLMTYPARKNMAGVNQWLTAARDRIVDAGIACNRISIGGTPNLGEIDKVVVATEHRAGTYIYNDRSLVEANACGFADCALRVRATVVSRPTRDRAVIDAGSKILTSDLLGLSGFGHVVEAPDARISELSEEHGIIDLSDINWRPDVGDTISIIPNHACVVSNMVDRVVFIEGGRIEAVEVDARGRSQ